MAQRVLFWPVVVEWVETVIAGTTELWADVGARIEVVGYIELAAEAEY